MAFDRFDIYDIVVDIIPATVFALLLFPLLVGDELLGSTLLTGIVEHQVLDADGLTIVVTLLLVAVLYVAGRIIHGVSAPLDRHIWRGGIAVDAYMSSAFDSGRIERAPRFYERLTAPVRPVGGQHRSFDQYVRETVSRDAEYTLETALSRQLLEEVAQKYDVEIDRIEESDLGDLKHISYSVLYNRPVLYRRYELMTTFFRSLYVLFGVSFLLYLLAIIWYQISVTPTLLPYTTAWAAQFTARPVGAVIILSLQLLLFVVFFQQRWNFSHRRWEALLYDTVTELKDDAPDLG